MKELTAFIDESGNSGVKIFSGTDKFHWVGVMLSTYDVEATKDSIQQLVQSVEFNELHGGKLGLTRIEKISDGLISIYDDLDANFIFTRVEREHVATMKFVDLVFDSENNKAVPNWLYNVKYNRLLTAYAMAKTLTTEHRKRFWNALGLLNKGISEFQSLMNEIKEHCLVNSEYIPDLDLYNKIFDYAASHAEEILELDIINEERARIRKEGKREESDDVFTNLEKYRSANLATFNITLGAIYRHLQRKNSKITRVVHDEQDEFYKQLKHDLCSSSI